MTPQDTLLGRCFATALIALMLTLSAVVPVMDRGEFSSGPVAESEHVAAECFRGHDHSICTQVGANQAVATPDSGRHQLHQIHRVVSMTSRPAPVRATLPEGHPSRAPPAV